MPIRMKQAHFGFLVVSTDNEYGPDLGCTDLVMHVRIGRGGQSIYSRIVWKPGANETVPNKIHVDPLSQRN